MLEWKSYPASFKSFQQKIVQMEALQKFQNSIQIYGTPYLPYDIYFHYIRWFFIICGGYINIRGDLFIIFGT